MKTILQKILGTKQMAKTPTLPIPSIPTFKTQTMSPYPSTITTMGSTYSSVVSSGPLTIPTITSGTGIASGSILTTTGGGSGPIWANPITSTTWAGASYMPTHPLIINDNGKELFRIESDGKVVWGDNVTIDAAAEKFKSMVDMSVEMKAGIVEKTKQRIRDTIFGEIINIAKDKGSLTAEELTLILEATKIMEKLKG